MATGTRLMQEISDQFLNCKICFENFREPKTLVCLHTFCSACLQQQYDQEVNSRTSRYSIYTRQVTCPLCRKKTDLPSGGVRRLPDNFLVSNLTEVVAKRTASKIPPCEICSTVRSKNVDACSKCLDCSKVLCKSCVDLHLSTKVTAQHSLIDLEGEKDIECKVHPEENVRFYCEPCDACICVVCAFQEHRDHEVCSFNDGSVKYRGTLEALLGKCKTRLEDVSTRLNTIEKYETVVKDVRERIRDLAISYIAKVRTKERELMKRIEEVYGGEIKDFIEHKPVLQENMDELQSTCSLTDIMLKDKGVELLLIKKEIEGRMNKLLEPRLPDVPSDPKYEVRFVPGDVALGRLSFGDDEDVKDLDDDEKMIKEKEKLKDGNKSNGCLTHSSSNEPDVITNCTQTEKCRTKEMSTSMLSDMKDGFSTTISQTDEKLLDKSAKHVETRERGVYALVQDVRARGTMTERSDVRSLKCQTEKIPQNASEATTDMRKDVQLPTSPIAGRASTMKSLECGQSATRDAETASELGTRPRRRPDAPVDLYQSNNRGERAPAPDLLPTGPGVSAFNYTPGRKIRSIKIQTEISSLDVEAAATSTDKEFANTLLWANQVTEKLKQEKEITATTSRLRDRPRRVRTVDAGSMTIYNVKIVPETSDKETSSESVQSRDIGVYVTSDVKTTDTQTPVIQVDDSSTFTDHEGQSEKGTSTQPISVDDKETCTPIVTSESKVTWTEKLLTSDRATCTVGTKTQDRATGTVGVRKGDMGSQITPYVNTISTNTPVVSSSDHESQTKVDTTEQGTIPDAEIEKEIARKEKATADAALDSSVDFVTPPQSPIKSKPQTCDRASDAIKIQSLSKATETARIKTVSSSTETPSVKFVDKDTATNVTKTIDQWTETPVPQLVNTGVTPARPATIEVGVSTVVVLTDEQATCTDVKSFRDSHTETVLVVCDNETLTDATEHADAQTSVEIQTENQECETDKMENTEEGSMTDYYNPWEAVDTNTHATQCETPILRTRETNTTRHRRKAKEIQTTFSHIHCMSCGHITPGEEIGDVGASSVCGAEGGAKLSIEPALGVSNKEFKDSSTEPHPLNTQDVSTMAISCVTCQHDCQETAIQTSQPKLYDKASATSFELDQDFLERALSREYQDAATSTESLPYIGLLSEIDVDELIVVPEAAFELVSDTDSEYDHYDVIMVDDETSTDFLQYVEAGTQTLVPTDDIAVANSNANVTMTDSTGSGKSIGEVIRSMVQIEGANAKSVVNEPESKHMVSIGVNTIPKLTFEKETCTPIRHLFSKGTMTFYVSKMDKSTSTLNQARIISDSRYGNRNAGVKSVDKITMTSKAEHKEIGTETDTSAMDGKITECISKLRNVSERLNSPTSKKTGETDTFFGKSFNSQKSGAESLDPSSTSSSISSTSAGEKPEEERQKQLKNLLEQTSAILKPKDRSPIRKPQPITTLKCRKPPTATTGVTEGTTTVAAQNTLKPEAANYDSRSLPRRFSSDRPGTVRMGSQPLAPSRLPLLRYNSAPGRIATVPAQTLLKKSGQTTPTLGRSASPRLSPSKIPITKKMSPPDYATRPPPQPIDSKPQDVPSTKPQLRRPLPSITETRTPSSCSDSSTASFVSAGSNASNGPSATPKRLSLGSGDPSSQASQISSGGSSKTLTPTTESNRLSVGSATTTPSPSPSMHMSLSVNSDSCSDNVFRKSSTDTTHSTGSTETLDEKSTPEEKSPKKSGMGFMQRLLSKKKKAPEDKKKEPVSVIKAGPPTAAAVAALAAAVPPLPTPAPESQAHTNIQFPPHHYPPPPEHKSPALPRKPRPFVYVRQRIFSIQQDNVEEVQEKKGQDKEEEDQTPGGDVGTETTTDKDKEKDKDTTKDKEKEKAAVKQKEKSKKEEKARLEKEKEKAKKEEKAQAEKEKAKAKGTKTEKKTKEKEKVVTQGKKGKGSEK